MSDFINPDVALAHIADLQQGAAQWRLMRAATQGPMPVSTRLRNRTVGRARRRVERPLRAVTIPVPPIHL